MTESRSTYAFASLLLRVLRGMWGKPGFSSLPEAWFLRWRVPGTRLRLPWMGRVRRMKKQQKGIPRGPAGHTGNYCNICHTRFTAPLVRLEADVLDSDGQVGHIEVRPTG